MVVRERAVVGVVLRVRGRRRTVAAASTAPARGSAATLTVSLAGVATATRRLTSPLRGITRHGSPSFEGHGTSPVYRVSIVDAESMHGVLPLVRPGDQFVQEVARVVVRQRAIVGIVLRVSGRPLRATFATPTVTVADSRRSAATLTVSLARVVTTTRRLPSPLWGVTRHGSTSLEFDGATPVQSISLTQFASLRTNLPLVGVREHRRSDHSSGDSDRESGREAHLESREK